MKTAMTAASAAFGLLWLAIAASNARLAWLLFVRKTPSRRSMVPLAGGFLGLLAVKLSPLEAPASLAAGLAALLLDAGSLPYLALAVAVAKGWIQPPPPQSPPPSDGR